MLIGAFTVIVLAASVLLTLFVGRGSVPNSPAAGLPRISGVSAPHLQAFLTQPGLGDPAPEDIATRSGLLG
jgi:hypothetical protein